MKIIIYLGVLLACFIAQSAGAESLQKVTLDEDKFLLLDVAINNQTIASSVDAYSSQDDILIALEPLFDGLKLRYQIIGNKLDVWRDQQVFSFNFEQQNPSTEPQSGDVWASDGIYQFISVATLERIFALPFRVDLAQQKLIISSDKLATYDRVASPYLFPVQILALQSERRQLNRFYNNSTNEELPQSTITISDQYRLFTPPHGQVYFNADLDDQRFNGSVQLVSDLLYHSASLTLSQSDDSDLASSLNLSRYKKSPNDRILGLFDAYHFGDVSGQANNLTTESNSGVGIVFERYPDGFRNNNLETTIEEIAPPGWDAELFHNGAFIDKTVVPGDGRLIFQNVRLYYGLNDFEIRLYGPYGEEDVIADRINVKKNPLSEGQMAYSLNALDKNHRVFNNDNDDPFKITNFGGSYSYGISDQWQIGMSFASIDNDTQLYSIKNNLSFNNFLLENDISLDQNGSYAQLTTLTGSIFNKDSYSLIFESADNFESDVISARDDSYYKLGANYTFPTDLVLARIGTNFQKNDNFERIQLSNIISKRLGDFNFTHGITYDKLKWTDEELAQLTGNTDNFYGSLGINSRFYGFLLSAFINYDPTASDPFLKDSSVTLRKNFRDPFDNRHSFQAQYFPLVENGIEWRLNHNLAWESQAYQLNFSSSYDSKDEWNLQFGIRFFLGYDYYNNRVIMDREISGGTATLDVHTYLDRQMNGVPDVLDYNLEGVSFGGHSRWEAYRSNEDGRTILPGVYGNSEFAFNANWQEGSATINNDYVVYTHPGAYVEVNMPFYLITDLSGFVVRTQGGQDIPLRNVVVDLVNGEGEVQSSVETDQDGYYEFVNLSPDKYQIQVNSSYLKDKGMTGEVIGFDVMTSGRGGFVELPTIVLARLVNDGALLAEEREQVVLDENNTDALVWDKDERVNRNYFTLPRKGKGKLTAKYSLDQELPVVSESAESQDEFDIQKVRDAQVQAPQPDTTAAVQASVQTNQTSVFNNSTVLTRLESSKSILPKLTLRSAITSQHEPISQTDVGTAQLVTQAQASRVNIQDGWVLQLMSMQGAVDPLEAKRVYSAIGPLYLGHKTNAQGQVLNCVISQVFSSREQALSALSRSGLQGWVTQSSAFQDVKIID